MTQPQTTPEQNKKLWDTVLQILGTILPMVPSRWRPLAASVVTTLAVLGAALFITGNVPTPGGGEQLRSTPMTAITFDQRDLELRVQRDSKGNAKSDIQVVSDTGARSASGEAVPQAPLMDWENIDVRLGRTQTWCLQEADANAQQIFRDVMNELSAAFPTDGSTPGIRWQEACPGPYTLGATAQIQCGDGAVACAGPSFWVEAPYSAPAGSFTYANGRVSYNGDYRDHYWRQDAGSGSQLSDIGMKVALAHEVQHIELNLGHNGCGRVVDPTTGQAVPSTMSPIYLPDGPTCTEPGATGLTTADWPLAIKYYALAARRSPRPSPSPSPSPSPTPAPQTKVITQIWTHQSQVPACPTTFQGGGWCVQSVDVGPVPAGGAWLVHIKVRPDGGMDFGPFERVDP
jgi:hypothetical protein